MASTQMPDDLLTRGQMANINQVTKKALLLYQEKGLLEPAYVDEGNGYCYYAWDQCARLDAIIQLQQLGLSLGQIGDILDSDDIGAFDAILDRQIAELEYRLQQTRIALRNARDLKVACSLRLAPPVYDQARLVWMPERHLAFFPIEPYVFREYQTEENKRLRYWEMALRGMKRTFVDEGIPLTMFHGIKCVVDRASFDSDYLCIGGAIDDELGLCPGHELVRPQGWYLSVDIACDLLPDGRHAEYVWLTRLLGIADRNGYRVTGHYVNDVLGESPAFNFEGRDMAMRLWLPVDLAGHDPAASGLPVVTDPDRA